ncbi:MULTISPECIES: phage head closure protein [unclassified Caballeronia]|uniref:phage head closure protein n=1 Tax=unclassified Caballeronia TaxID=2646786 RepID=UPI0020288398|nr:MULTISPECIES: phage head closure protein [unclassified Caballeronia]
MPAGVFNRTVRIERRVRDPNRESIAWELVIKTRAFVIMQSGKEIIAADAPISITRASVRIRYSRIACKAIRQGMRLTVDGLVMRIEQVQPDVDQREYIQLICVTDERRENRS